MKGMVIVGLIAVVVIISLLFFRPLPDGTMVTISGEGYFNPLCCTEKRYELWSVQEINRLCQPTLVEDMEGLIVSGGDYQSHYHHHGAYRVVFNDNLGNQKALWFATGLVKKLD